MRGLSDLGMRVIVAMFAGAGLVALASGVSQLLQASGLPGTLGGWPLLAALAALLCGVCALVMSLALRWPGPNTLRLTVAALASSALTWGICLAAATLSTGWTRALADWPWLVEARPTLASIGGALAAWLILFAMLAGLLAGQRRSASVIQRSLTPQWLAPLWGASVGLIYGLLYALFYTPPCIPDYHCYGLNTTPWDGLSTGVVIGLGAGAMVGLTLSLALWLALALRPADQASPTAATHPAGV